MSGEMPVAITGGTGFVGQAVLDATQAALIPVEALARKVPKDKHTRVDWVQGSLDDLSALEHLVAGSRAVIHIAGLTSTPNPQEFEQANVTGTANVIAAMKRSGVKRLVFVSSLAARKPELSEYGASKFRAEQLVEASGLDWTIVRPPAVYGPRDKDMFELFRSAKFGLVPLPPSGATSIIHVDDLAQLLVSLAVSSNSGSAKKRIYEPDDGREGGWSHKELGKAIGAAMNRPVMAINFPAAVLQGAAKLDGLFRRGNAKLTADRVSYMTHPNWVARSDRAVPNSLWQPQIEGENGLKSTADWYKAQGWL
ncbi:MAG: NAD(P)-dependent oxidoreductase [Erythrobacter sp.]